MGTAGVTNKWKHGAKTGTPQECFELGFVPVDIFILLHFKKSLQSINCLDCKLQRTTKTWDLSAVRS